MADFGEIGKAGYDRMLAGESGETAAAPVPAENGVGMYAQAVPACARDEGLFPILDTAGQMDGSYAPLQDATKSAKATSLYQYRNALPYPQPKGVVGILLQTSTADEVQRLFFPQAATIFVDEEGEKSTRVVGTKDGYANYAEPASFHSLAKIVQLPGGAFAVALNLTSAPDGGGYGAIVAKMQTGAYITKESYETGEDETGQPQEVKTQPKQSQSKPQGYWRKVPRGGGRGAKTFTKMWVSTAPKPKKQTFKTQEKKTSTEEQKEALLEEFRGQEVGAETAIGLLSYEKGGPITPGGLNDQHVLGKNSKKQKCMSAHISTNALYYRDTKADGPIDFSDLPYPAQCTDVDGIAVPTYLSWDNNVGHRWGSLTREGLWRGWTVVPNTSQPRITTTTGGPPDAPDTPNTPGIIEDTPMGGNREKTGQAQSTRDWDDWEPDPRGGSGGELEVATPPMRAAITPTGGGRGAKTYTKGFWD